MFHTYVLQSQKDGSKYVGFTERSPSDRLIDHNQSKVKSTKNKQPWNLIYYEGYIDKKDALSREKFLKGGSGNRYIKNQLKYYLSKNKKQRTRVFSR